VKPIGLLGSATASDWTPYVGAFRQGLREAIDELVEHLNKEFKTSVMVGALRDKASLRRRPP